MNAQPRSHLQVPVLLLSGPGSRRLEALAFEKACALICRTGTDHGPATEACPDCRRIRRREHPDVMVGAPERRRWCNTPAFEDPGESKETTIPTGLVRAIASDASRLPYEAGLRAILLLDVDKTESAAMSALLKVLEEPPLRTRFLLTATRSRLLPSTILSRVALLPCPGTSREETAAGLRARGLSSEEAEARTAFVPNDIDDARTLDLPAARALRDGLLEAASGTFLAESPGWALALGALLSGDGTAETAQRLALLATLLRDAVAAVAEPAGHDVRHKERFRDLSRLSERGLRRLLDAADGALRLASELQDSRRNPRLAVEAYALSLLSRSAPVSA